MESKTYLVGDNWDGQTYVDAESAEEAISAWFDPDPYREARTVWVTVTASEVDADENVIDGGDSAEETFTVNPVEPPCKYSREHDWQSPHSVVGGLEENPGVVGNGGGVIATEVCAHCGAYRITDSWAQNPNTGEQGLDSIEYRDADDRSLDWSDAERAWDRADTKIYDDLPYVGQSCRRVSGNHPDDANAVRNVYGEYYWVDWEYDWDDLPIVD